MLHSGRWIISGFKDNRPQFTRRLLSQAAPLWTRYFFSPNLIPFVYKIQTIFVYLKALT